MIKLIASDIDGTFINDEHVVTKETAELVRRLTDYDIHFVLATGRSLDGAKDVYDQVDFKDNNNGIICLNGLRTYNYLTNETIVHKSLTDEDCQFVSSIGQEFFVGVLYCFDDLIYLQMDERSYEDFKLSSDVSLLRYYKEGVDMKRINDYSDIRDMVLDGEVVSKIVFVQSHDYLDLIEKRISKRIKDKYHFMMVAKGWAEINPFIVNKANALEAYAKKLGIEMNEVIAFGDAENDIEMIKRVGIGIAVDNAMDTLKEVADQLTLKNSENGVIFKIKQLLKEYNNIEI